MDFSPTFNLPVALGGTIEEVSAQTEGADFNEFDDLEGFLEIPGLGGEEGGFGFTCIVEEGKCVTFSIMFVEFPITDTFLGLSLQRAEGNSDQEFAAALEAKGIPASVESDCIVLPEHFMQIDLSDSITWWAQSYWSREGFLEETLDIDSTYPHIDS